MKTIEEKAREYIKDDIIRRFKEELRENNLVATVIQVREENECEVKLTEILEEYINEYIEKTENEKDVIGTADMYEKYEEWFHKRYEGKYKLLNTANIPINLFGRQMHNFFERGVEKTRQNKTIRGFKYIKYKSNPSKVKEFMEKFIIQTEDSVLDRIPIKDIYYTYLKWLGTTDSTGKMGPETFNTQMQKTGSYRTKQARLKKEVTKENGKVKIEAVGKKYDTHLCVMKVKWVPGAIE